MKSVTSLDKTKKSSGKLPENATDLNTQVTTNAEQKPSETLQLSATYVGKPLDLMTLGTPTTLSPVTLTPRFYQLTNLVTSHAVTSH